MHPPSPTSPRLQSLLSVLRGMWRAFVSTCGLLLILAVHLAVVLWENSGVPATIWQSAFLEMPRVDGLPGDDGDRAVVVQGVGVKTKGRRGVPHCTDNNTVSLSTSQFTSQPRDDKQQAVRRNNCDCRNVDDITQDCHSLPPLLPLDIFNPVLCGSQEVGGGHQVKGQSRKGWEICIEEYRVQEVRTPKHEGDTVKVEPVVGRGADGLPRKEMVSPNVSRELVSPEVEDNVKNVDRVERSGGCHGDACVSQTAAEDGERLHPQEPSIFGTLTKEKSTHKDHDTRKRSLPQTSGLPTMFTEKFPEEAQPKQCNGTKGDSNHDNESTPALVYQDGNLHSGTLEAFVQHMVPTVEYYPDRTYLFAFLLNSRLFIKPHQLLHDVCQVCLRQQKLGNPEVDREAAKKFSLNLLQMLIEWTETFPYDFRDERMMRHLRDLTQKCVAVDQTLRKNVGQIMQALIRKLATLEKYEDVLSRVNAAAQDRMHSLRTNPAAFQTNIMDVCPSAYLLAQQLTHIELERLANIGPEEFVQSFLKEEKTDPTLQLLDLKRTKNLEAYVEWFNRLSYLVATEVCMHIKKKHRARLIEYFIDVARECYNIGNFNSLMAIMSGLNLSPVTRLKKTWSKVNLDKFEILEHQMDPSGNFNTYRQSLRAAMQRALGAQEGACDRIVIPFFSLFVKDLYFLNEGCKNKLSNGYINFQKFWQTAKQVTEFMTWKQVECPYPRDRQALNYLLTAPVFSENSLYLASYESEGPETVLERSQYKTLKLQCSAANK